MTENWTEVTTGPKRKRPIMRDTAHQRFMNRLYSGDLKPGHLVSQRELCELLDIPMGPMREALKRLEAEAIVTLIPQRGIKILDIEEKVIHDTFQLRKLIEPEAVRIFTLNGSREAARDLMRRTVEASNAEDAQRALDLDTIHALTSLDHEMHYLFLGALENDLVIGIFRRMLGQLRLSRLAYRLRNYNDRRAYLEHIEILNFVIDGDADAACGALARHLDASWDRALGLA